MLGYNVYKHNQDILKEAAIEARTYYEINLAYRSWVATVGGVYAPIDKVKPNPYLKAPNRDISTDDNKHLTLVNPAYMTRLVFEIIHAKFSLPVINKLTSLKYLNPANSPNEWEKKALLSFEKGATEALDRTTINNEPYLRLMKPFITEGPCLKCHGQQGYKIGDVRGGISIAVPLRPFYVNEVKTVAYMSATYLLLWLVGCIGLIRFSLGRYQQAQKIIESEGKFRALAETTHDWEFLIGEDNVIKFMATSSEPLTGYPPALFISDPAMLLNTIYPEDRELWKSHLKDFRELPHQQMELRIVTKQGEVKWISHVCAPIYQEGVFLGRHVSNRDITDRRKYENEMLLGEARFEALFQLSNMKKASEQEISDFALASGVKLTGSKFGYIHFVDEEGKSLGLCSWPEDALEDAKADKISTCLLESPGIWTDCFRQRKPLIRNDNQKGHSTIIRQMCIPVFDDNEKIVAVAGVENKEAIYDESDVQHLHLLMNNMWKLIGQKRAEEALRKSEESLSNAQRIAHIGNWDSNIITGQLHWSDEVYRIFGLTRQEFGATYEAFLNLTHPDDRQKVMDAVNDAIYSRKPYSIEHRIVLPDGTEKTVHEQGEVQYDTDGKPIQMTGTVQDISNYKKLEAQLMQAQKMEAIGRLAAGVAHDFNNMLTAMIGYGNLLQMRLEKDSPLKVYVNQILGAAEKSANLTYQLLAFSRKQTITPKETNLNELIRNMEKLLLRLIGEDIVLKTQLTGQDVYVMVDPGQIEQVLMNLCTNARDTMPNGGLLSVVTDIIDMDASERNMHDFDKAGRYVMISVSDTGMGIDEKTKQRIFEPFFTTKEIGKGTGLGLSIVYGIIKQHRGDITVYSERGKGTTFRIYLPLIGPALSDREAPEALIPRGGTETILVAEDNEDVRDLTVHMLKEFGYDVIESCDGDDAVNKFVENKDKIKFVLLDVIMPKKNGKEVYDEIKMIKPDTKILFTSGYTADLINQKGILEESMDFISKPVTPHALLMKIREILDRT